MNRDLDKLVEDYRDIKASPHLATRINAHVNTDTRKRFGKWWSLAGAGALAVVVGVMLTSTMMEPSTDPDVVVAETPSVPGFSQLASSPVTSASLTSPSFSNLRSVNSPALPDKPVL